MVLDDDVSVEGASDVVAFYGVFDGHGGRAAAEFFRGTSSAALRSFLMASNASGRFFLPSNRLMLSRTGGFAGAVFAQVVASLTGAGGYSTVGFACLSNTKRYARAVNSELTAIAFAPRVVYFSSASTGAL